MGFSKALTTTENNIPMEINSKIVVVFESSSVKMMLSI